MDEAVSPGRGGPSSAVLSWAGIGLLGVLTFLPLDIWIRNLQAQGKSAAALAMSDMHMEQMHKFWAFPVLQATGLAGLIWAYVGVALGLFESGKTVSWFPLSRPRVDRLHRQISLLVIVAFYLALLLGPTYYLRRLIGVTRWRFLHRFVVVVYILSFWHAMILGLDVSHYGWVRPFMWLMQIPLLVLFVRRLLQPAAGSRGLSRRRVQARAATARGLAVASGVAIVAVAAIVATGNSDFIHTV